MIMETLLGLSLILLGVFCGFWITTMIKKDMTVEEASKFLRKQGFWVTLHLKPMSTQNKGVNDGK